MKSAFVVPVFPGRNSHTLLAVLLGLGLVLVQTSTAQPNADLDTETLAIDEVLQQTATALVQKDVALAELAFAENFAGPFRIPQLAQATLKRVINAAETVSADFQMSLPSIVQDRAVSVINVHLAFQFKGGASRNHDAEYVTFFRNELRGWVILAAERLDPSWEVTPDDAGMLMWPKENVQFPVPVDWDAYPTVSAETKKSVIFVSPDLKATIGIGLVQFPMAMELETIVANQKGVPQLYPGSAFIGQKEAQMGNRTGIQTELDVKIGSQLARVRSMFVMRGTSLYVASLSVTSSEVVSEYEPVFADILTRFTFLGKDDPKTPDKPKTSFADPVTGLSLTVPAGWTITEMPADMTQKKGWLFALSVGSDKGKSTSMVLGARDLPNVPGMKDLPMLQQSEMGNIRAIAEDAKVHEEFDTRVAGCPARSWVYSFTMGQEHRRREVFFVKGKRLFFLIADVMPVADYAAVSPDIDALLQNIALPAGE